MPSKKTGLFLSAVSEPIVNRVMQEFGYTKISNAVNYIILEYDKMINKKQEAVEVKEEVEEPKNDLSSWFVVEDK